MLLGNKEGYDFEMTYYNANGLEGSMCGNGGRCLTQFAYDIGLNKNILLLLQLMALMKQRSMKMDGCI